MIKVNHQLKPNIKAVGESNTPVIVIDNYSASTNELIQYAAKNGGFGPDQITLYPGIRSPLPKDYVVSCLKPVMKLIYSVYGIPPSYQPMPKDCYFSLVTLAPNQLSQAQTIPHFDTNDPNVFAVLHYLNAGDFGDTAFFRHRQSGLEFITDSNKKIYSQAMELYLQKTAEEPKSYCDANHSEFECYKTIGYQQNRLAIYPGCLLHSALVNPQTDINPNPLTGRLTANMFIKFSTN